MNTVERAALILAAGDGKRMKSNTPKVLCEVAMKPMISWVLSACADAGVETVCAVMGAGAEQVRAALPESVETVLQTERRGTGHAVLCAEPFLRRHRDGDLLVLCGDAPFVDADTIEAAYRAHRQAGNAVTVLTARLADPTGYGRILRTADGIAGIVEQKDATAAQLAIDEVNSGAYWFKTADLLTVLGELTSENAQREYYLTDTIALLLRHGCRAGAYTAENDDVVLGANDRKALLTLNEVARRRILERHLENGVEFLSTDGVLIGPDVEIGADTRIYPNTILAGKTTVGTGCVLGPNTKLQDCTVGDQTTLLAVWATESVIHNGVKVGPFTQLRPNAELCDGVKIGDFVEIKNSVIGEKTAVAHLTYVGDSDVGSQVNFGCGTVTVNYNGVSKARTTIGDRAFIGCNTNLVAPVRVGDDAFTAAGTTVTEDVPDGALAIGRSRQTNKPDAAYTLLHREKPKK